MNMTTAKTHRGPQYRQLPIWNDAMRLLVAVEKAVRQFTRYHKYTLGTELRRQALGVCRRVARAAQSQDTDQKKQHLERLVWQIEDFKINLQLAKEVEAFTSFAQFQTLVELAVSLGKQSGGWWKRARSAAPASNHPVEA